MLGRPAGVGRAGTAASCGCSLNAEKVSPRRCSHNLESTAIQLPLLKPFFRIKTA